jgi:hypothetical protein
VAIWLLPKAPGATSMFSWIHSRALGCPID